jgi:hypothetical protein
MLVAIHPLTRLYYLYLQLFGLLPSALILIRQRQVAHTKQRVRILGPKHRLTSLYHLHLQLFGLLLSALIPVR